MRPLAILSAAFFLCAPGFAGDREFDSIVRLVEARYDTNHARVPLFGMVNFFVKVARPGGASDLKLAVFGDLSKPMFSEEEEFTGLVRDALGPGTARGNRPAHSPQSQRHAGLDRKTARSCGAPAE